MSQPQYLKVDENNKDLIEPVIPVLFHFKP